MIVKRNWVIGHSEKLTDQNSSAAVNAKLKKKAEKFD